MSKFNQFQTRDQGVEKLVTALVVTSGAADGNKIVQTGANGLLDASLIPAAVSSNVQRSDTAASAISAGNLINFGPAGVRPADSSSGYPADGFAPAAVASTATGTFSLIGVISGLSGLTKGTDYFLGANGAIIPAASLPTASGSVIQRVGKALSTTELDFEYSEPTFIN